MPPGKLTVLEVKKYISRRPKASYADIGRRFDVSRQAIHNFLKNHPEIKSLKTENIALRKHMKIYRDALMEIADVGCDLSRDLAIRTLESMPE